MSETQRFCARRQRRENKQRSFAPLGRARAPVPTPAQPMSAKKKLSYLEAREYSTMEERIAKAEADLAAKRSAFEDPTIATDAARLIQTQQEMESAQAAVDELYARWAELEAKKG